MFPTNLEATEAVLKEASDPNETREAFIEKMAAEGYVPSYPGPYELQLDLDNEQHEAAFQRSFEILSRELSVFCFITYSRSGVGKHVRIQMPHKLETFERIAWQAALGSDPVRELLSCLRALRGDEHPTMLIEKADWKQPDLLEGL